jgi:hypothetical protein
LTALQNQGALLIPEWNGKRNVSRSPGR